ncbi:hypothetical protein NGRA_3608, partial [Nosema granulosis]
MQKASIQLISYILRIDRDTFSLALEKISKLVVEKYYNTSEKIGGNNTIVEMDESKFGMRKYNRGHHVEGVWVLGMVEKDEPKRIKLFRIDDRSKTTLESYIIK